MPIVAAICSQCGAELQIDNTREKAFCPYCGTPFVIERPGGDPEKALVETLLHNAEVQLTQLHQPGKARELFAQVTEKAPDDYRGWWGLVRIDTKEFSDTGCSSSLFQTISRNADNALRMASDNERSSLLSVWNRYIQALQRAKEAEKASLASGINAARARETQLQQQIDDINRRIQENQKKVRQLASFPLTSVAPWVVILIVVLIAVLALDPYGSMGVIAMGGSVVLAVILYFGCNIYCTNTGKSLHAENARLEKERSSLEAQKRSANEQISEHSRRIADVDNMRL